MPVAALKNSSSSTDDGLSPRDLARISNYVHAASGIKLPVTKGTMVEGRLRRRVRATQTGTLSGYCDWLFSGRNLEIEGEHLINAVTTNKTDFFREVHHFDYLVQTILPELARSGTRRIHAWSAGCSTGAEPYTIAMLLDANARDKGGPDYGILATDLDTEVLGVAHRGIFPADALAPVPPLLRQRYVLNPLDGCKTRVRMAPALRTAIGFARLNLMDDIYPVGDMNLIFCRNVLIYFDRPTQEKVITRLTERLVPGGHLFLGHSETIAGFDVPLIPVANTVFRKR